MGQRINKFLEDLRLKLANIESGLNGLKAKIDSKAQNAEEGVRNHLAEMQRRIAQGRTKVTAAQSEVKTWVDEQKLVTSDKIAEWKAKRETTKLQNRADNGRAVCRRHNRRRCGFRDQAPALLRLAVICPACCAELESAGPDEVRRRRSYQRHEL